MWPPRRFMSCAWCTCFGHREAVRRKTQDARRLGAWIALPLLANDCQRVRNTPPQSALRWQERDKNVRNAFRCDVDLTGKRIVMVDDVMTSGASLNALAEALSKQGATEISAWVVARTLPGRMG